MSQLKQNIYYNDSGELVIFTYRVYTEKESQKRLEKLSPPEEKTLPDIKISNPQRPPAWLTPKPAGKGKLPEETAVPKPAKQSQKKQPIISPVSLLTLNPQDVGLDINKGRDLTEKEIKKITAFIIQKQN